MSGLSEQMFLWELRGLKCEIRQLEKQISSQALTKDKRYA